MVPMHLGLIDGPSGDPVLLAEFQMTPRLKILMSSGSKKGIQICFSFLWKSPSKRIPSRFLNGAPIERDNCLQGIFTCLLIYIFISKALKKSVPPCSPKAEPQWEQTPIPKPYLIYLLGSPVKEPSLQVPLMESPQRKIYPVPRAVLHSSFEVHRIRALPPHSTFPSDLKGTLWREMPVFRAFLNISSRVPSKGALPRGPPHWASSERDTHF
jgi:hypothetical protein